MRVALITVGQETDDFNPVPTTMQDYRSFGLYQGAEILARMRGLGEVGGYLAAVEGSEVETLPIIRGWAVAGGRITPECHEFFLRRMRDGLRAAGRIDALALQLHGACAAAGEDDVEGAQAALCREVLGPEVPIVLMLDHHANLTRRMVEASTAIVAHRTQPHDPFDTGRIGGELLLRILRREVRPVMAWRKIPMLTHQEQFLTDRGPMKLWFDRSRAMEREDPRVLHAANFPMQPWIDVAEGGWAALVVADGDRDLAERRAEELADLAWGMRERFMLREALAVDDAVRRADAAAKGVVLLSDTGDSVFGGAAGDSNLILEALLRLGVQGPALVPMIAPESARRLAAAGEGATVTLPLGGHATPFFRPLEVTGRVLRVGGGMVRLQDGRQPEIDMGVTVVFEAGPAVMLISEYRGVAGNLPEVWRAFGVDPAQARMAVLKTASNFQWFAPIASEVIRVDTRGPTQSDIAGLPWRRQPRPVWPLDPIDDRHAGGTGP
jgi:microcystin degradation protein MlrC